MKRIFPLCFFATIFLASCDEGVIQVPDERANVKFVNLIEGISSVRIRTTDNSLDKNFSFEDATGYLNVLSGRSAIIELLHPDSSRRFTFQNYILAKDAEYTIYIVGKYPLQPTFYPLKDTLSTPLGKSAIRVTQLSNKSTELKYFLVQNADTLPVKGYGGETAIYNGESSLYNTFDSGEYTIYATDNDTGENVAQLEDISLQSGAAYSIYTYDKGNQVVMRLIKHN